VVFLLAYLSNHCTSACVLNVLTFWLHLLSALFTIMYTVQWILTCLDAFFIIILESMFLEKKKKGRHNHYGSHPIVFMT